MSPRSLVGFALAVVALVVSGCSDSSTTGTPTPTPLPTRTSIIGPTSGASVSPSATDAPGPVASVSGTPIPSETIRVAGDTLVTHVYIPIGCGVEWMEFEGQWYRTRDPVKNPPEGWTKPTQDGDVRVITKKHVRYEPYGIPDVIDFYRTNKTPPPCNK